MAMYWAFALNAQYIVRTRPYWIEEPPTASRSDGFYFFVSSGEGKTYDDAYNAARTKAMQSFRDRLGNKVTVTSDSITTETQQMQVRMMEACHYQEDVTEAMRVRVYVLWEIAKSYNVDAGFVDFEYCKEAERKSKKCKWKCRSNKD